MTAAKRRFRGPGGGLFVPHPLVDEHTIKTMVDAGEWTPVEEKAPVDPEKPLEKRTVDELRQYADEHEIDLGEAKKKDEILAAIAAATASQQD